MQQHEARDISKGDLPTLILGVLMDGPCHGYAIAREVERRSGSLFRLREGSLYPALRALESEGCVASEWNNESAGASRRIYTVSDKGREEWQKRALGWRDYVAAMNLFLGGTDVRTA